MRPFQFLFLLLCLGLVSETSAADGLPPEPQPGTYYIDFDAGSDLNAGTSVTTPWKHAPVMEPFKGSYIHVAGDRFIFKGGVVWPNGALPLLIIVGGAEGKHDYYGVDKGYYSGNSWTQPIFDAEKKELKNHKGNHGNVIEVSEKAVGHVTIDGFEIRNFPMTDPVARNNVDGFGVFVHSGDDVIVKNVYVHDWVVAIAKDCKFGGIGACLGTRMVASHNRIVAPTFVDAQYVSDEKGRTSGCGIFQFDTVDGNEIVGTTQGIWSGNDVHDNIVRNGCDSFDAAAHENGAWVFNGNFYNNTFTDLTEGVCIYFLPGWGGRTNRRINIYNNIFTRVPQINLSNQANSDTSNQLWFFNNLVHAGGSSINVGTTKNGKPMGKVVVQNNIFITAKKYESLLPGIHLIKDTVVDFVGSHNVVYTPEEAAAVGLGKESHYLPPAAIADLVDKGVGHADISNADKQGVPRPAKAAWDIGPYEWTEPAIPNDSKATK